MAQQVQYYGGRDNQGYNRNPEPRYRQETNRSSWSDQRSPPPSQPHPPNSSQHYRQSGEYYDQRDRDQPPVDYQRRDRGYDANYNRNQYNNDGSYQREPRYSEPAERQPQYSSDSRENYDRNQQYVTEETRQYPPPPAEPVRRTTDGYRRDYQSAEQPRHQEYDQQRNPPQRQQGHSFQDDRSNNNQQYGQRYNDYQRNDYERDRQQQYQTPPPEPVRSNYNEPNNQQVASSAPRSPVADSNQVGRPQVLAQTTATSRGGAAVFGIVAKVGRPENMNANPATRPPPSRSNDSLPNQSGQYNQQYRPEDDRQRSPVRTHPLTPIMEQPSPSLSPQYQGGRQYPDRHHPSAPQYDRPPQIRKQEDYYNDRPPDGYREDSSGYGSASTYNDRSYDDRPHYDQQNPSQIVNRPYMEQPKPAPPPSHPQQNYANQSSDNYGRDWNENNQNQQPPPVFHQQNLKRHWTLQKKPDPPVQKPFENYRQAPNVREPDRDSRIDKTHVKSVQAAKSLFDKPSGPVPLPQPKAAYVGNQYSSTGGNLPPRPRIHSDPDRQYPQSPTNRPQTQQIHPQPHQMSRSMNNLDRLPPNHQPQNRNSYSGEPLPPQPPMVVGVRFDNDAREKPQYNPQQQVYHRRDYYDGQHQVAAQHYEQRDNDEYQQSWQYRNEQPPPREPPVEHRSNHSRAQAPYEQPRDSRPQQSDYGRPDEPQHRNKTHFQPVRTDPGNYNRQDPPPRSPVYPQQPLQDDRSYPSQAPSQQGPNYPSDPKRDENYYQDRRRPEQFQQPSQYQQREHSDRQQPQQYDNQYGPQLYGSGDRRSAAEYDPPRQEVASQRFPIEDDRRPQPGYQAPSEMRQPQPSSQRNSYVPPPEEVQHSYAPPPRLGSPTYNTSPQSSVVTRQQPTENSRPLYSEQREARQDSRQVRFQQHPTNGQFEDEAQRQRSPDSEVSNYVPSIVARSYQSFNQQSEGPAPAAPQKVPARPAVKPNTKTSEPRWPDPPPPMEPMPPNSYDRNPKSSHNQENRSQYQTRQPPPGRDNNRMLTNVPRHPFDPDDEDDDSSEGIDVDAPTPPPQQAPPKKWGSNQQIARRVDAQRQIPAGQKHGYDRQPGDGLNNDRFDANVPVRQKQPQTKVPPNKPKRNSLKRTEPQQTSSPAPPPEVYDWDQDNSDNGSQNQLNHDHSKARLRVAKSGGMSARKPPTRQGSSNNLIADTPPNDDFAIEVTPNDLRKVRGSPITVQQGSPEKPQTKSKSSLKNPNPQTSAGGAQKHRKDDKQSSKLVFKVPSPETAKKPTAHPLPDLQEPLNGERKQPPTYTDLLGQFKSARDSALLKAAKKQDQALKAISGFQPKRNPSPVKSPPRKPETVADKNASKIIKSHPPKSGYDENKDIYNRSKPRHDRHSPDERSNRTSVKSSSTITGRRNSDSSSDHRGRSTRDRGRSRARSRDRDLSPNRNRGRSRSRERLESPDRRRGRSRSRERIMSPDRRGRSPSRERNVSPSRRRRDHSRERDLDRDQRTRKSERYNQPVSPYRHRRDEPPYNRSHHHRGGSDEPEWVEQYRKRRTHHGDPSVQRRAWVNDPRWQAKKEFDMDEYERDVKRATSYNSDFEQPQQSQMFPSKLMHKGKAPPSRHPPSKNDDWMRNLKEQNKKANQRRFPS